MTHQSERESGKVLLSNPEPKSLDVWIEPWCDELSLSPRSSLSFEPVPFHTNTPLPELEIDDDRLIVWATAPGKLIVSIDGVEQDTGSSLIDLPGELLETPVKNFVSIVFGGSPEARPGGIAAPVKRSFWKRLLSR